LIVTNLKTQHAPSPQAPAPPAWLAQWVGPPARERCLSRDGDGLHFVGQAVHGPRFTHTQVRVPDAHHLPDLELQHATTEAYRLVRQGLDDGDAHYPVRFWNFIPGIVNAAGAGLDRYMVFNAGRFAAFADWFHAADRNLLAPHIATATGVGHAGNDLIVHALGDRLPGKPVENPRQCAAYRYSQTYGPLPPCFARATVIAQNDSAHRQVIVGGTSSIIGEDSVHVGDLSAQTRETLTNIEALLHESGANGLKSLRCIRVYHVQADHAQSIFDEVSAALPHLAGKIEMMHAPLCRPDLGVEIEGLADAD